MEDNSLSPHDHHQSSDNPLHSINNSIINGYKVVLEYITISQAKKPIDLPWVNQAAAPKAASLPDQAYCQLE